MDVYQSILLLMNTWNKDKITLMFIGFKIYQLMCYKGYSNNYSITEEQVADIISKLKEMNSNVDLLAFDCVDYAITKMEEDARIGKDEIVRAIIKLFDRNFITELEKNELEARVNV